MAELLKNIYTPDFFVALSKLLQQLITPFDVQLFLKQIYDKDWDNRELKARMYHISATLKMHLSDDFKNSSQQLLSLINSIPNSSYIKEMPMAELAFMFIPDYIEKYGIDDFDTSTKTMEEVTKFSSCEFAVRPFIIKYEDKMLALMTEWCTHKDENVRRLASEGSRPRLPWAMALPSFKKDPTAILPLLELLKHDPSEYVRRSVANSLNDISKDNPQLVIGIAKNWMGQSNDTDKLVKHACRTLLKDGHQEALQLFGFGAIDDLTIKNFEIITNSVKIGESLAFNFDLYNNSTKSSKIRLEYGLYFLRNNGSLSRKVFKISEKVYKGESITRIERKQSFKIISTRKFYTGTHKISLIVNGIELREKEFELLPQ